MLLKATDIKSLLTKPGKHADGAGLYLFVRKSASWVAQYRFAGKTHWATIGPAALVSLADARKKHLALRLSVFDGVDPRGTVAGLAAPKGATFGDWLAKYIEAKEANWGPRERRDHEREFALMPELCALPVSAIGPADKQAALAKLTKTGRRKAKSWIGAVIKFSNGIVRERSDSSEVEHHAAMAYASVPAFYATLAGLSEDDARALRFTILTGLRTGEVTGATWAEIEGDVWTVDASRMKARKVHRVPLSPAAVALLGPRGADNALVFKVSHANGMLNCLKAIAPGCTVHGFRTSFETWAAEQTNFPRDLVALCTAHDKRTKVDKAYQRSDLLERRREIMQRWSDFVAGQ